MPVVAWVPEWWWHALTIHVVSCKQTCVRLVGIINRMYHKVINQLYSLILQQLIYVVFGTLANVPVAEGIS